MVNFLGIACSFSARPSAQIGMVDNRVQLLLLVMSGASNEWTVSILKSTVGAKVKSWHWNNEHSIDVIIALVRLSYRLTLTIVGGKPAVYHCCRITRRQRLCCRKC